MAILESIKEILGFGPKVDFKQLLQSGGIIIDVRTRGEYQGGHIKGSINIPLQNLPSQLAQIKKGKAVITCCASGARSASAKRFLISNGFTDVHNGGGWMSLNYQIQ